MTSEQKHKLQRTALALTHWIGSPQSIAIHTAVFLLSFITVWFGVFSFDRMLLVLTTLLSLEAIYLSLFIQMTVNYTTQSIAEVEQNIDEIQEDVGEIQEDIGELQEDVSEMSEDEQAEQETEAKQKKTLDEIHAGLQKLMQEVERLQSRS